MLRALLYCIYIVYCSVFATCAVNCLHIVDTSSWDLGVVLLSSSNDKSPNLEWKSISLVVVAGMELSYSYKDDSL